MEYNMIFKNFLLRFFSFLVDPNEWIIFFKRILALFTILLLLFFLWWFPISPVVSIFYSSTNYKYLSVESDSNIKGTATIQGYKNIVKSLLDKGLITDFIGVRYWIDNNYYQQIGIIEILRPAILGLENYLARNRSSGNTNTNIVMARGKINGDFKEPFFPSYSRNLKHVYSSLELYSTELSQSKNNAVFIVNSDNLADFLDLLKKELMANNSQTSIDFMQEDNYYYRLRGKLIALRYIFDGIDKDFGDLLRTKGIYDTSFNELYNLIKEGSSHQPSIIISSDFSNDYTVMVSKITTISMKISELKDKLEK
jgi:hypothetical protein